LSLTPCSLPFAHLELLPKFFGSFDVSLLAFLDPTCKQNDELLSVPA